MKKLIEIIRSLEAVRVTNEEYYKLDDLRKHLTDLDEESVIACEMSLEPYYYSAEKIMELYEYQLDITINKEENFEKYVLNLTKKDSINDIPKELLRKQKICFIQSINGDNTVKTSSIIKYIDFIFFNQELQEAVNKRYDKLKIDNLFFEMYLY